MKLKLVILLLIIAVLQSVQQYLTAVDNSLIDWAAERDFLKWLKPYRNYVIPVIAFSAAVIQFIASIALSTRENRHEFRKGMLNVMRKKVFGNDRNVRITVFKEVSYFRIVWQWLATWFICQFTEKIKKKKSFLHLSAFPQMGGKYIQVSERVGAAYSNSKTYFFVSKKTEAECEGLAAIVYFTTLEEKRENLPDVNGKPLAISNRTVRKYLEQSLISFDALQRLNLKARHIYATILVNSASKAVGVLVIDSVAEESPFSDSAMSMIDSYVELLTATY